MYFLATIKQSFKNLMHAKLRSFLALLGVLVGTASVVAMVLGGKLATDEALKQFKTLGTDLLSVSLNSVSANENDAAGKVTNLTLPDALQLRQASTEIESVAPLTISYYPVSYEGTQLNSIVLGVTHHFASLMHLENQAGRFISPADHYEYFCVLGHAIYQQIKRQYFQDPIGKSIKIGKQLFTIIGVTKKWPENNFLYVNLDQTIFMPLETSTAFSKYAAIHNLIFKLKPDADIPTVEARIKKRVTQIVAGQQAHSRSAKALIEKMRKQSDILTIFLGLIGCVSLLVGGIGVMNIMLVSVVERKREIGIRLAVGASPFDISFLFLLEAITLALLGGIMGVVIGTMIAYAIAYFWHWTFTLYLMPLLAGFTVSVLVGIFFGFYPAYLASKLNPIDALRSE